MKRVISALDNSLALNHARYRKPYRILMEYIKRLELVPEGPVWIYPEYPIGWYAIFGAHRRLWIISCKKNVLSLSIEPQAGMTISGGYRRGITRKFPQGTKRRKDDKKI